MPIGKGGSFTPLTWKNVDTGNPAAFFNGAIAGADRLVDQSQKINAVEDDRLLNEALNRQRLGQPAQFDRRVDQIALQESQAFDQKLKSDLLGAKGIQAGQLLDNAGQEIDNRFAPRKAEAEIGASEAATGASLSGTAVDNEQLRQLQIVARKNEKTEADRVLMNKLTTGDWNKARDDELDRIYALNPDVDISDADRTAAAVVADKRISELIGTKHYRTANNIGTEGFNQSEYGALSNQAATLYAEGQEKIRVARAANQDKDLATYAKLENDSSLVHYNEDGSTRLWREGDGKVGGEKDQTNIIKQLTLNTETGDSFFDPTQIKNKTVLNNYNNIAGSMGIGATRYAANQILNAPGGRSLNSSEFAHRFTKQLASMQKEQRSKYKEMNPDGSFDNQEINKTKVIEALTASKGSDPGMVKEYRQPLGDLIDRINVVQGLPAAVKDFYIHPTKARSHQEMRSFTSKVQGALAAIETNQDHNGDPLEPGMMEYRKAQLSRILMEAAEPYE